MLGFLFKNSSPTQSAEPLSTNELSHVEQHEVLFGLRADSAPDIETLENQFMAMLMDGASDPEASLTPDEAQALDRLTYLLELDSFPSNRVPRLPQVIPKLLVELRDENSSAADLVNLITEDLTLVAEVIRLSNSAYYRTGDKIESLKQAVVKLGINGVRQLVASALFKPILHSGQGGLTRVLGQYLWEKNQKAALAGNYIALHTGDDRFHAYLAGLLSQSGMIIAIKELDDRGHSISSPFSSQFLAKVDELSQRLSVTLSKQWEMPEEVILALTEQTTVDQNSELSALASAAFVANKLAKISLLEFKGALQDVDEGFICQVGGIRSKLCRTCYNFINLEELREQQDR